MAAARHGPVGMGGLHCTVRLHCCISGRWWGIWRGRVGTRPRLLRAPPPGACIAGAGPRAPNHSHRVCRGPGIRGPDTTGERLGGVNLPPSSARLPRRRSAPFAESPGRSGRTKAIQIDDAFSRAVSHSQALLGAERRLVELPVVPPLRGAAGSVPRPAQRTKRPFFTLCAWRSTTVTQIQAASRRCTRWAPTPPLGTPCTAGTLRPPRQTPHRST